MRDVESVTGSTPGTHQLIFQGQPLQSTRHGKRLTLRDCRIRKEETLFLQKMGFTLNITNPQVLNCLTDTIIYTKYSTLAF